MRRTLFVFFFNDTATTEIYTLSLHDALPIYTGLANQPAHDAGFHPGIVDDVGQHLLQQRLILLYGFGPPLAERVPEDRKSTRLNSSHANISYAVFCLKKKKNSNTNRTRLPAI